MCLEDAIGAMVERNEHGIVEIVGRHGSGKTLALRHLAAVLPPSPHVRVIDLDDSEHADLAGYPADSLIIADSIAIDSLSIRSLVVAIYPLAAWGDDELIEYLLAVHPERCGSVMARLRCSSERQLIPGIPELWRIVLDRMAADESVVGVNEALRLELRLQLAETKHRYMVRKYCLDYLTGFESRANKYLRTLSRHGTAADLLRLIRHRCVQVLLAAEEIASSLNASSDRYFSERGLPRDLMVEVAARLDHRGRDFLISMTTRDQPACHATAASLLHAMDVGWRPESHPLPRLLGAYLAGAKWAGIDLSGAFLDRADLNGADLTDANLNHATAVGLRLAGAMLQGVSVEGGKTSQPACRFVQREFDLR